MFDATGEFGSRFFIGRIYQPGYYYLRPALTKNKLLSLFFVRAGFR